MSGTASADDAGSAGQTAAYALLVLAVCAVYFNALWADFQFDDYKVIVDDPRVHSWQSWLDGLSTGIRPLLKLSYLFNWISGWGVAGFHLTNIAIHLANVLLVFALTRRFISFHPPLPAHVSGVPLFTALLFALHPIHTEAVTYVSGRSVALMTLFYLLGLLAYASGREHDNKMALRIVTPLCLVVALGVKETAVTFPLALLVWELCCGGSWRTSIKNQWPVWSVCVLGALVFLFSASYSSQMERSAGLNSLQGNLATQLGAFSYLLRQWAFPLWLNLDPDLHVVHGYAGLLPQLLLLVVVFLLMSYCLRRRPWISFGLAWAVVQLLPLYVFLPRLDVANDRQMYLVSWPLLLACMAELSTRVERRMFVAAGLTLALALASLTLSRNQVYQNEISLWEDTVAESPGKARAHNNLGYAYLLAGRDAEARREFVAALKIEPANIKARDNLQRVDLQQLHAEH